MSREERSLTHLPIWLLPLLLLGVLSLLIGYNRLNSSLQQPEPTRTQLAQIQSSSTAIAIATATTTIEQVYVVSTQPPVTPSLVPTETPLPVPTATFTPVPVPTNTPTPTPGLPVSTSTLPPAVSTSSSGEFKSIGQSYEKNGIVLTLVDYEIESNGNIHLKFTAANKSNRKILLQYQNNYFTVADDLGGDHPQTKDSLYYEKQYQFAPDATLDINSQPYSLDQPAYIGLFAGKLPEEAKYLIIRVAQFADLQAMQWRIPLNSQLSNPQSPAPGTEQALAQNFSANGVTMTLADYNINTDGSIALKFQVLNRSNSRILFRYQNKYFEVTDDLGTIYSQSKDALVEPKQILVSPGARFDIYSQPYSLDQPAYIGMFTGKVPPQAKFLIIKVARFADLQAMQWRIPLR